MCCWWQKSAISWSLFRWGCFVEKKERGSGHLSEQEIAQDVAWRTGWGKTKLFATSNKIKDSLPNTFPAQQAWVGNTTDIHRRWVWFSGFLSKSIPLQIFKKVMWRDPQIPWAGAASPSPISCQAHETSLLRDWVQNVLSEKAVHSKRQRGENYMERSQGKARS